MERRFNVDAIGESLHAVRKDFPRINDLLDNRREELTVELVDNMLAAYRYLNGLLDKGVELFSPAGLYSMLELNHIVLCGTDLGRRTEYYIHLQETRKRFQRIIADIYAWYREKGRKEETYRKAAKFYVKALSQPQLFLEGNHRTENIVVNYILLCDGEPPFVLGPGNALGYFNPSTKIKFSSKESLFDSVASAPGFAKDFRKMLKANVDAAFLA